MIKKHFYIEENYILTKNDNNWDAVKWMLDLPIWDRTNKKPSPEYKKYKMERRELSNKKSLTDKQKIEKIKKLDKNRIKTMDEIITTTHRTFLRAFGDLICERGDPSSISAPAILKKFRELVIEGYDKYTEDQIQIISKKIDQLKGKYENKEKLKNKEIKNIREKINKLKKKHLKKVKQMNKGRGLKVVNKINSLNNWLNGNRPSLFIKKVGENYKLLVYYFEGSGELEYFCSDKNKYTFIEIVDKNKRDIKTLKNKFESIVGLQSLEEVLKPPPQIEKEFFPICGPYDYNFDNEWVLRRPEVNNIIKNLTPNFGNKSGFNNVQFLVGNPATGKTVIARNVGYDLQREEWKVYQLSGYNIKNQVSDIIQGLNYLEAISNRSLIIIEDIHKCPSESAQLIDKITNPNNKVKFLITGTSSFDRYLKRDGKIIFEKCETIDLNRIKLEWVIDSIISNYKIKINSEDCNRIKKKTRGNLWILSYFLRAWTAEKGIDMSIVYDLISKDIEDITIELRGSSNILFTLAPFSTFDVGVEKSFLMKKLSSLDNINNSLEKLIEYGKIIDENGFFSIPHSTVASLFVETKMLKCNDYNNLSENIVFHMGEIVFSNGIDEYPREIIQEYFRSNLNNYNELTKIIIHVGNNILEEKVPFFSLKKLFNDNKIIELLNKSIKNNFFYYTDFLLLIFKLVYACETKWNSNIFSKRDAIELLEKIGEMDQIIENMEKIIGLEHLVKDTDKIDSIIGHIHDIHGLYYRYYPEFFSLLIGQSTITKLKSKIISKNVPLNMSVHFFTLLSEMIEKDLSEDLKEIIESKIKTGVTASDFGIAISNLYKNKTFDQDLSEYLIEIADPNEMISKFEDEKEPYIYLYFPYIKKWLFSDKRRMQYVAEVLSSKINEEKKVLFIADLLSRISYMGEEFSIMVLDNVNQKLLRPRITEINEDKKIEFFKLLFTPQNRWFSMEEKINGINTAKLIVNKLNLWNLLTKEETVEVNEIIKKWTT